MVARIAPRLRRPALVVAFDLFATAALALGLPLALQALVAWPAWAQQGCYALLFALSGVVLGAGYPANTQAFVARVTQRPGGNPAAAAGGLIDALDHLGATLGALTVGTIILPALGTQATLHAVALGTALLGAVWLARVRLRPRQPTAGARDSREVGGLEIQVTRAAATGARTRSGSRARRPLRP